MEHHIAIILLHHLETLQHSSNVVGIRPGIFKQLPSGDNVVLQRGRERFHNVRQGVADVKHWLFSHAILGIYVFQIQRFDHAFSNTSAL